MPGENGTLTPVWIAYVDGMRLGTGYEGALKRIYIHDRLDFAGTASLVFDLPTTDFDNGDVFSEGSEVSVHLGYKDDVEEVFSGEVTGFVPRFGEYGAPQMEVQIETKLHRLDKGIRSRAFESKTTAQIIKEIITNHNLKAEVEEFGPKHNYTEQRNITDYDYITQLACKYGKTVWCQGNTVYVKTEITPSDDDVILEWGKSIISARAKTSIAKQLSAATCTGWSIMDCRGFAATATMKLLQTTSNTLQWQEPLWDTMARTCTVCAADSRRLPWPTGRWTTPTWTTRPPRANSISTRSPYIPTIASAALPRNCSTASSVMLQVSDCRLLCSLTRATLLPSVCTPRWDLSIATMLRGAVTPCDILCIP